eukprot:336960_1
MVSLAEFTFPKSSAWVLVAAIPVVIRCLFHSVPLRKVILNQNNRELLFKFENSKCVEYKILLYKIKLLFQKMINSSQHVQKYGLEDITSLYLELITEQNKTEINPLFSKAGLVTADQYINIGYVFYKFINFHSFSLRFVSNYFHQFLTESTKNRIKNQVMLLNQKIFVMDLGMVSGVSDKCKIQKENIDMNNSEQRQKYFRKMYASDNSSQKEVQRKVSALTKCLESKQSEITQVSQWNMKKNENDDWNGIHLLFLRCKNKYYQLLAMACGTQIFGKQYLLISEPNKKWTYIERNMSRHINIENVICNKQSVLLFYEKTKKKCCNWKCQNQQLTGKKIEFKKCSKCSKVWYCCRKCQKYDWNKLHRKYCPYI